MPRVSNGGAIFQKFWPKSKSGASFHRRRATKPQTKNPAASELVHKRSLTTRIPLRPPLCTRYLPTASANTHIQNVLVNTNETKDVQVVGVGTPRLCRSPQRRLS